MKHIVQSVDYHNCQVLPYGFQPRKKSENFEDHANTNKDRSKFYTAETTQEYLYEKLSNITLIACKYELSSPNFVR